MRIIRRYQRFGRRLAAGLAFGAFGILTADPVQAVPTAPVVSATAGPHVVTLEWSLANTSGGAPISGYNVYRSTGPAGPFSRMHRFYAPIATGFAAGTTVCHDGTASPAYGHTYYYLVSIVDDTGTSAYSSAVQGKPTRDNWPRFRGDSYLTGYTSAFVPDRLELMWRSQLPADELLRGQIYYDGRIYLTHRDKINLTGKGYLRNYDAVSGLEGTSQQFGGTVNISPMAGPNGIIYCAAKDTMGKTGLFGYESGPSLNLFGSEIITSVSSEEFVYLNLAFTGNNLVVVGVQDGNVRGWDSDLVDTDPYWQQDVGVNQAGGIATLMNGNLVFALRNLNACNLVCYTAEGELVWTRTLSGSAPEDSWTSPVAVGPDGRVYAALGSAGLGELVALKPEDGSEIWNFQLSATPTGLAVLQNGDVILNMSSTVYCIAADKTLRWQTLIPATSSAPALVTGNGKILVPYQDWPLAVADERGIVMLRESDGALVWNWRNPVVETAGLRDIAATPDGWFYVSLDDGLYAFTVPPVLELSKQVSATSAFPGQQLTYTLSWTNSSTMTASNFSLYDTLPNGVSFDGGYFWKVPAGATVSASYSASAAGPYTSGTPLVGSTGPLLLRWDISPVGAFASGELGFAVRISSTFTGGEVISNRGSGTYFFGSTTTLVESGLVSTTVILPLPGLKVEKSVEPIAPLIGGPVTYRIVVTNSSPAIIETLTVTDTLPAEIVNTASEQPAAFSAPSVTPSGSASLYAWSQTGLSMQPGTAFTFTVTGELSEICLAGAISNTAYAMGVSLGGATEVSGSSAFAAYPADLGVGVLKIQTPFSGTVLDDWAAVSYQIVVINAGTATVTGLTVRDTLSPVIGSVSAAGPSIMGPVSVDDADGGTHYEWSQAGLNMPPGTIYTFTVTGVVQVLCKAAVVSNSAWIGAASACSATEAESDSVHFILPEPGALAGEGRAPPLAGVGQVFEISLTVTNTGSRYVTSIIPQLAVGPGTGLVTASTSASPWGPVDLAPGVAQTFRWSVTAEGAGLVSFTMTGAGLTCASTSPALGVATVSTTIQTSAILKAAAHISATMVATNQLLYLTLSVTNSGGADLEDFNLAVAISPTNTAFAPISGPVPAVPSVLPAGESVHFSWVYRAADLGESTFMLIASGKDSNLGTTINAGVTKGPVMVYKEATLQGSVWLSATSLIMGDILSLTFTVSNAGEVVAYSVTPTLSLDGTGTYAFLSQPSPGTIPDSGSATFTWTLSVTGRGTLGVTAGGLGTSALSGLLVGTGPVPAASPLIFLQRGWIEIASFVMSPPEVTLGDPISAVLGLSNPGDIHVTVDSAALTPAPPSVLALTTAPSLPVTLPPAGTQTLTWVYSTQNCGAVSVSAEVSGYDEYGDVPGAQGAAAASILGQPVTMSAKASPVAARVGGLSSLEFVVIDSCGQPVPAVAVNLSVLAPADAGLVPAQGVTDGAGSFTSRLVLGGAPGLNVVRGEALGGTNPSATVQVEGGIPDKPVSYLSRNFFNPGRGEKLRIKLIVPAPMEVRVRIHNIAGELVRNLNGALLPAGMTFWEWDGRNDSGQAVGSGTYFIQISAGDQGEIKRVNVIRQ